MSRLLRTFSSAAIAIAVAASASAIATASASPSRNAPDQPPIDDGAEVVLGSSAASAASSEDRYLVQTRDEAVLGAVLAELSSVGVAPTATFDDAIVGFAAPIDARTARRLRRRDGVVAVERDRRIELSGRQTDPPWNLDRIDQRTNRYDASYSYTQNGTGVHAYVIDSGIRPTHVDFRGRLAPGAYWDFGDGMGIRDCNGHGTHVAGTVGGTRWGVAKGVTIVPVKVFDCSGSTATSVVVTAIDWIIDHHRSGHPAVVNMSLGGPPSVVLDDAVERMIRDRITVVIAAGNSAANSCSYSPARVPWAITVAASTRADDDADFSNYGSCNDLFAPGVDVRSASHASDRASVWMSGTSMAAPHVAGAAALVLERNPAAAPGQVWATLDADTTRGALSECCGDPDKLLYVRQVVSKPTPPRALSASAGDRAVWLRWRAPGSDGGAPVTDYVLQISTDRGASWRTMKDGVSTSVRHTVRGLVNDQRYHFRVAARNAVGVGPWTAAVAAIPTG